MLLSNNPLIIPIFNTDWFIHSSTGTERVEWAMKPDDFEYLRNYAIGIPVIHNNAYLLNTNSVIMNPPPIFIPCPSTSFLLIVVMSLFFRKR